MTGSLRGARRFAQALELPRVTAKIAAAATRARPPSVSNSHEPIEVAADVFHRELVGPGVRAGTVPLAPRIHGELDPLLVRADVHRRRQRDPVVRRRRAAVAAMMILVFGIQHLAVDEEADPVVFPVELAGFPQAILVLG